MMKVINHCNYNKLEYLVCLAEYEYDLCGNNPYMLYLRCVFVYNL